MFMRFLIGDHAERPCVSSSPDLVATKGDWQGDEFIIVATDGLWDIFSSELAVQFVHEVHFLFVFSCFS